MVNLTSGVDKVSKWSTYTPVCFRQDADCRVPRVVSQALPPSHEPLLPTCAWPVDRAGHSGQLTSRYTRPVKKRTSVCISCVNVISNRRLEQLVCVPKTFWWQSTGVISTPALALTAVLHPAVQMWYYHLKCSLPAYKAMFYLTLTEPVSVTRLGSVPFSQFQFPLQFFTIPFIQFQFNYIFFQFQFHQ